jgi:hypothetical protein
MRKVFVLGILFFLTTSVHALDFEEKVLITIKYGPGDNRVRPFTFEMNVKGNKSLVTKLAIKLMLDEKHGFLYLDYGMNNDVFINKFGKDYKLLQFGLNGKYIRTIKHPDVQSINPVIDEEGNVYFYDLARENGRTLGTLEIYDQNGKLKNKKKFGKKDGYPRSIIYKDGAVLDSKDKKELLRVKFHTSVKDENGKDHFYNLLERPKISKSERIKNEELLGGFANWAGFKCNEEHRGVLGIVDGKIYCIVWRTQCYLMPQNYPQNTNFFYQFLVIDSKNNQLEWKSQVYGSMFLPLVANDSQGNIYNICPLENKLKIIKWSIKK